MIDVVEADIVVHFSHRFPWRLARHRRFQRRGTDKACVVYYVPINRLMDIYFFRVLQTYNFIYGVVVFCKHL